MAIGWLNGWLTWRFRLPSLLVTLGFLFIYRGLVEYVTDGKTIVIPDELRSSAVLAILGGKSLGMHNSVWICAALLAVLGVAMAKTQYGSHVQAVGGDVNAALATGVPAGRVKIRTFIASSMLAGFAGIITAASLSSVSTTTATAMEFEAIAATVIGGVSLLGGSGTVNTTGFQSSPGPKAGCYLLPLLEIAAQMEFQSSPGPKAGCYLRTHLCKPVQVTFQSSPGPKAGCYRSRS